MRPRSFGDDQGLLTKELFCILNATTAAEFQLSLIMPESRSKSSHRNFWGKKTLIPIILRMGQKFRKKPMMGAVGGYVAFGHEEAGQKVGCPEVAKGGVSPLRAIEASLCQPKHGGRVSNIPKGGEVGWKGESNWNNR